MQAQIAALIDIEEGERREEIARSWKKQAEVARLLLFNGEIS